MFGRRTNPRRIVPVVIVTAIVIAILGANSVAGAQALYGSITGTVADQSGAAVPGAEVTARAVRTGASATAVADSSGIYRFPGLLADTYTVTISAQNFAKQETAGVIVRVNEVTRLDAQLKVASSTQSVTVTTEAPLLQTDKADVHTDITSQQINNLPIMGSQGAVSAPVAFAMIPGPPGTSTLYPDRTPPRGWARVWSRSAPRSPPPRTLGLEVRASQPPPTRSPTPAGSCGWS